MTAVRAGAVAERPAHAAANQAVHVWNVLQHVGPVGRGLDE